MSATNTISIRLEVTGDAASISKITNVMNGFKGLKGGIQDAQSAMQKQWSTGSLTGLGNAIGQTQAQTTTLKTRLTEIGSTLASNAAAFGVATASVWGVYNAYDSLVKVEIRAETAMNRVSTMTTTLATLENRLSEARTKGNLSAEEMAVLEDRITNTKAKLATAQERSADLQGDVNEAWGAFASQVGPQVVAAGGSIVQLYTNMRGSLTGIVPKIKDFISNLSLGGGAAKTMAAGINPLASVMGELPAKTNAAAKGFSALSGAMQGLIIGGGIAAGILAIGTAIAYFRDQELKALVSSAQLSDAVSQSEEAFAKFEETSAQAQKTLDVVVKGFGSGFQELIDKARTLNLENTFNSAVASISQSKKAIVDLNPVINGLKEKYMEVTKNASFFDIITGKLGESQKILTDEITRLTDMQNKQGESIKTNTALTERLRAAIALKSGVENKDLEFVLQAIAAGLSKAEAYQLLNVITEQGTKSLNTHTVAVKSNNEMMKEGLKNASDWLAATAEKAIAQKQEEQVLRRVVIALGLSTEAEKLNVDQMHELIEVYLGLKPATDAAIKANEEWIRSMNEAQVKADELDLEYRDMQNQLDLVNRTFGTSFDPMHVYGEQLSFLTDLAHEQNFGFIEQEQGLAKVAQKYGVLTTEMVNMTQNLVDNTDEMTQGIAANIDWNEGLRVNEERLKLVHAGQLAATTSMADFVNGLVTSQAQTERENILLRELAEEVLGSALPKGIQLTNDELRNLITAQQMTGEGALELEKIMQTKLAPALERFTGMLGATSWKEFKDAWKELKEGDMLKGVPDKLKDSIKDIGQDLIKVNKHALEASNTIAALMLNVQNDRQKGNKSGVRELKEDLEDMPGSDKMQPVIDLLEDIEEMSGEKRTEALKKYGDTLLEIMAALDPSSPGGRLITPGERKTILAQLGDDAEDATPKLDDSTDSIEKTGEATKVLTEEQQKIIDNKLIKATIDAQTGAFELQTTYINKLNEALLLRAILIKSAGFGSGGGNNGGFVRTGAGGDIGFTTPEQAEKLKGDGEIPFQEFEDTEGGEFQGMIDSINQLITAIQTLQTAIQSLTTYGIKNLQALAKESSTAMSGMKNNLNVGYVSSGHLQEGLANLANEGSKSLAMLASASSKNMSGMKNNFNVGYVSAGHLQTGIANLANEGDKSLSKLAKSSSTNMNGFVNNLKKGVQAVNSLKSAIAGLKDKTVHIGLTGPGVKFLAHGFHGVVDKPTLMVVGEAGPEKVDVSPVTGAKATGLQFENQRNVKIEPVGKLDTGPRFERETIHDRTGPSTIQLVTYTYLYPGSNEYRKSIQQVSLDGTGSFPTA